MSTVDEEDGWTYWSRVYSDPELRINSACEDQSLSEVLYGHKLQRTKVIIDNLPKRCSEEEIKNFMEAELGTAKVMRVCSARKGYRATVEFYLASDAVAAVTHFDGYRFRNRRLKVFRENNLCDKANENERHETDEMAPTVPVLAQDVNSDSEESFFALENEEEEELSQEAESTQTESCKFRSLNNASDSSTKIKPAADVNCSILMSRNRNYAIDSWSNPTLWTDASAASFLYQRESEMITVDEYSCPTFEAVPEVPLVGGVGSFHTHDINILDFSMVENLNLSIEDNEDDLEELRKCNHDQFSLELREFFNDKGPIDYSDHRINILLKEKASSSVYQSYITWLLGAFRTRKHLALVGKFVCIPEDVTLAQSFCTALNETFICKEVWEPFAPSEIKSVEDLATYFTCFLEFFGPMWIYDLPLKYFLYSLPSTWNMSPRQLETILSPVLPNLLCLEDTFYLTTVNSHKLAAREVVRQGYRSR